SGKGPGRRNFSSSADREYPAERCGGSLERALLAAAESKQQPASSRAGRVAGRQSGRREAVRLQLLHDIDVRYSPGQPRRDVQSRIGVVHGELATAVALQPGEQHVAPPQVNVAHPPRMSRESPLAKKIGDCELVQRWREDVERLARAH